MLSVIISVTLSIRKSPRGGFGGRGLTNRGVAAYALSAPAPTLRKSLRELLVFSPLSFILPPSQTHGYIQHGTTTLFAASHIFTGKVIGQCLPRHRGREFVIFLRQLEQAVPPDLEVRLILDNYSTHKCPPVQRWPKSQKRQRFHFHFTPTNSSWLNQVERWFAEITRQQIRRGSFHSVKELEPTIYQYLAAWDQTPRPFVWVATADIILDKIRRGKELNVTEH
jgi:transposase